jgi:CheY-like chemotaxis protein
MKYGDQRVTVLMADDDADDRMLTKDAWEESRPASELDFVEDGEQLIDYLRRRGRFSHLKGRTLPNLILLDLNMPKKDGREALVEIKGDPDLRRIPIIVLTTSNAEEDVHRSYELGVNSFIVKPVKFEALVEVMRNLSRYWFEIVELPYDGGERARI